MLKLKYEQLKNGDAWEKAGVKLPGFDITAMLEATGQAPAWVHFGGGNIFRGFVARLQQDLLNAGLANSGIITVSAHDFETIERVYIPYDNMCIMVTLMSDGGLEKEIIASVAKGLCVANGRQEDREELKAAFRKPSLQMLSFTITEKGYALKNMHGEYFPNVLSDFANGPENCTHAMSIVVAMLLERYNSCRTPIALVSMDNCSHNGEILRGSVMDVISKWQENGFVPEDFCSWAQNEDNVSFPWSMIDKITPRPAEAVERALNEAGIADMGRIITAKKTYLAPFVNTEKPEYLVIEDRFPNGRPPLEKAGVYMTDRDTVNKAEKMKVTTCLNPLHTALAVYGCLLGYETIAAEMKDPLLKALAEKIGYKEGIPVVADPVIFSPMEFLHEVIDVRLPNPFMPDAPQRIATDTSQKVPIRFGETIKSYIARPDLDPLTLTFIPLAIAGWLRYLLAADDKGDAMECSSDPMLDKLQEQLRGIALGDTESANGKLEDILCNKELFAVDLVEVGLSGKIEDMFKKLIAGKGAVRATLKEYLAD